MRARNKHKQKSKLGLRWKYYLRSRIIFTIIGLLIFLVVILVALFQHQQSRKTYLARDKVESARKVIENGTDKKFASMVQAVQAKEYTTSEIGMSKYDVCYISESDSGWFATNYYQNCYLRYVEGYTTNATKQQVYQVAHSASQLFSEVDDTAYDQQVFACQIAEHNGREVLRFVTPETKNSEAEDCGTPSSIEGVFSMDLPARGIVIKKLSGSLITSDTSDSKQNQIWIELDKPYYHEDLGCGMGILCPNPRPTAILSGSVGYDPY